MENALDKMISGESKVLDGTDYSFVDADTLRDVDGKRYRVQGLDSPEVEKYFNGIKRGTAGGEVAYDTISSLANAEGFTKVIKSGETDKFGRELIDLQNDKGESFRSKLLSAGVFKPTAFTKQDDAVTYQLGQNLREQEFFSGENLNDPYINARNAIETAAYNEGAEQQGFKQTALNEEELARIKNLDKKYGTDLGRYYNQNTVTMRDTGRDLDNMSNSPFSTSLDVGLKGVKESMYGALTMLGDTTGWDWASEIGEDGIARAQSEISRMPNVLTDYKDVNVGFKNFFDKDGIFRYVTNNAAMSLPYMAATIGSAVLAKPAALIGGTIAAGAVISTPAVIYAGQTYAEQDEKNKHAGIALASGVSQAVLDRLGLKGIMSGSSLLTSKGRDAVINKLMSQGMTKQAAKERVLSLSRNEMSKVAGDAAKFAKEQLAARNIARSLAQRLVIGGTTEAATEGLQEAIGYTATKHANNFEDWDANQFIDRVMQGAVAGGALGSSFAAPGTIADVGGWVDVAYRQAPATKKAASEAGRNAEKDILKFGSQVNVQDRNEQLNREAAQFNTIGKVKSNKGTQVDIEDLNDRVRKDTTLKKQRNFPTYVKDSWKAIPSLWRGLTRFAFDGDLTTRSDTARWLGESLGSALQRSTSGATYENRKHHKITELKNNFGTVKDKLASFGLSESRANRLNLSEKFYGAYQQALRKANAEGRAIDWDRDMPAEFANESAQIRILKADLDKLADQLHDMQKKYNPKLGKVKDYLSKYKSFSKEAIENNKIEFQDLLQSEYKLDSKRAKEITEAILNQDGVVDIDDAFSVTSRNKFTPPSHKKRTFGLSEKAEFSKFMENDLFTNISNASKSAVRYTTLQEYVGDNNSKLNYQLAKIEAELIDSGMHPEDAKARVNKLASELKDYFDAESGNYKRIKNETVNNLQKHLLFFTTITGLPLATLSNFVEIAMVYRGLTKDQIFGKNGLQGTGREFAEEIFGIGKTVKGAFSDDVSPTEFKNEGHKKLQELGYFDWEVGAAHTTGVTETRHTQQKILDTYFKAILLQQWTNATRASRAAIAGDFINDHLSKIKEQRIQANPYTNEIAESAEFMRNLGIDVEFMMDFMDKGELASEAEVQRYMDLMRDATFNFINEAVVLPQSANRPKIFQDPRFAMFTQFQGFISTFTANHIPKLWGEYVKRGTPAMKYNAFAMMATMIALGFASQHLKDLLKYGQSTPYFEGQEYWRRGIGASGLLGTGERAIDFVFPMFQERYSNPLTWAFGTISGESAAITKAGTIADFAGHAVTGQTDKAGKDLLRFSPLGRTGHNLYENVDWNFGE